MAYESDSVTRRTIGPALASTVVGVVLGIVAVIGVAALASQDTLPATQKVRSQDSLLGGTEYGSTSSGGCAAPLLFFCNPQAKPLPTQNTTWWPTPHDFWAAHYMPGQTRFPWDSCKTKRMATSFLRDCFSCSRIRSLIGLRSACGG